MSLNEKIDVIKGLYRISNASFASEFEAKSAWSKAINDFDNSLINENNLNVLETCILEDQNWELHVQGRIAILRKAKELGATSDEFLKDYYSYMFAHLDPGSEKDTAKLELKRLIEPNK